MAYSKTTWVSGAAPGISAANLNNIEQGIADLDTGTVKLTGAQTIAGNKIWTGWHQFKGASIWIYATTGGSEVRLTDPTGGNQAALQNSGDGSLELYTSEGLDTGLDTGYHFDGVGMRCTRDDQRDLGTASFRWDDVYATNGTIQTSDPRAKEPSSMQPLSVGLDFVRAMRMDQWRKKGGKRTHYSPNLESVRDWISRNGDFAGFIDPTVNPKDKPGKSAMMGWRPGEFVAPLYIAVQQLADRLELVEAR